MNHIRILAPIIITITVLSLVFLPADQASASDCSVSLGKKKQFDMELSPKVPLLNPAKDGYFYPGSPRITKNLEVKNVGDVPFKICWLSAAFQGDTHLSTGLQIKIVELGRGRGEKTHQLYSGILSNLGNGVEVSGSGQREIPQRKSATLQITIWMPKTAGNEYQGLSMTAEIAVTVHFPNAHSGGKD